MRRPLCVFCAGVLGMQLAAIFLPQTVFGPFAAFFVLACGAVWRFCRPARAHARTLLLGAAAGLLLLARTFWAAEGLAREYGGRTLRLEGTIIRIEQSYGGTVSAALQVASAKGENVAFSCRAEGLPACEPGQKIQAVFYLSRPPEGERLDDFSDGLFLWAEYEEGFAITGQASGFRAGAYRLQQALSGALRRFLDEDTGGVLAAMVAGDRSHISTELNGAYRAAGLSHVLVVSGMHATILCGGGFTGVPRRGWRGRFRQRKLWHSRARSLLSAGMALLLAGVTGFTPSVLRAAVAIWVSALGVWVWGAPDPPTSLALAGLALTLPNSYAVCDVGFELSFAAVAGTLAGAELSRRGRKKWRARREKNARRKPPARGKLPRLVLRLGGRLGGALWEGACIAACASGATFPVLVLRGMGVSLYALVSSVAVLWLVKPLLLLGIGAAVTGLFPLLRSVQMAFAFGGGLLAFWLNGWARWVASWPGAQVYFDTGYAAALCLLLIALALLAAGWRVRLRVALPALVFLASAGLTLGLALEQDVVRVTLVGGGQTPSAVLTQNGVSLVLYRGGASGESAVENQLARDGSNETLLLVDLRLNSGEDCALPAGQRIAVSAMTPYSTRKLRCGEMMVEIFRTLNGCAVRISAAGRQLVAVSGEFVLPRQVKAGYLLASPSDPGAFAWEQALTLREDYSWMEGKTIPAASTLWLRPGGGERIA